MAKFEHPDPAACPRARTRALAFALAACALAPAVATAACADPPGDVDADGDADVSDVQCSLLCGLWALDGTGGDAPGCLASADAFVAADVNCDNGINVVDVIQVISDALGSPLSAEIDADGNGCADACDAAVDDGCPDEWFPPVAAAPENGSYPDPSLAVFCEGGELVVDANGIPTYEFQAITPNPLNAFDYQWRIPLEPVVAASPTSIPLLGTVGIAVNGLPFYGPNEGGFPDPFGDPVYNDIVDFCGGHTAMQGDYHYHTMLVDCLTQGYGPDDPSPVLGVAFDGFPIYGSNECADLACSSVVTLQSGWVQTGDPTTYAWDNHTYVGGADPTILDACNGHVGPKGDYHYHVTDGFPHILGCYAGTPTGYDAGGGAVNPEGGGGDGCATMDCTGQCGPPMLPCQCVEGPNGATCRQPCMNSTQCMGPPGSTPGTCTNGFCAFP